MQIAMQHKNNFYDVQDVKKHIIVMLNVKKNIGRLIKLHVHGHNKIVSQHKLVKILLKQKPKVNQRNKIHKMIFMA